MIAYAAMTDPKAPGLINLPGIFAAAAHELLGMVDRGRILLDTHNIRDAGAPLEGAFRGFLSSLLPTGFLVRHGYLYDTSSACTPQIDLIIAAADRAQVMLQAPDGATYSAVTDAYALAEIKSSAVGLKGHLQQFAAQIAETQRMRRNLQALNPVRLPELITFMIIGKSDALRNGTLRNYWAACPDERPDYILLVDRGQIIMPWSSSLAEFGMVAEPTPQIRPSGEDIGIFQLGDGPEARCGNALLWLYYALLQRLRKSQALELETALREIAPDTDHWSVAPKRAAERLSSAADPFAVAMTRNFKLELVDVIKAKAVRQGKAPGKS